MKKAVLIFILVCCFSVSALAATLEDFVVTNDDGTTSIDYHSYYAAVAAEKVAAAGLDMNLDLYWVYDSGSGLYFDNEGFEADYAAAMEAKAAQEQAAVEAEEEVTPNDTGTPDEPADDDGTGYPVGSFIDEAGNVFSPDGELLSPGTTPAAPAGTYDTTSPDLLDGSYSSGEAAVYTVTDMRSVDDGTGSVASGLKALIISIFGEYEPVLTTAAVTETVDNVTTTTLVDVVADGAAGIDFEWLSGVFLFGILLFCLMKLLGGVLK